MVWKDLSVQCDLNYFLLLSYATAIFNRVIRHYPVGIL